MKKQQRVRKQQKQKVLMAKWWLQHIILMLKGWSRVIIKKNICLHHHEVIKGFCRKIYPRPFLIYNFIQEKSSGALPLDPIRSTSSWNPILRNIVPEPTYFQVYIYYSKCAPFVPPISMNKGRCTWTPIFSSPHLSLQVCTCRTSILDG